MCYLDVSDAELRPQGGRVQPGRDPVGDVVRPGRRRPHPAAALLFPREGRQRRTQTIAQSRHP